MGLIKGQKEYKKFIEGKVLTRKGAILAMCYQCNGQEDSNIDCGAVACPLYQYHPHRPRQAAEAKPKRQFYGFQASRLKDSNK